MGRRAKNARKGQLGGRFGRTAAGGERAALGARATNNAAPGRGCEAGTVRTCDRSGLVGLVGGSGIPGSAESIRGGASPGYGCANRGLDGPKWEVSGGEGESSWWGDLA